MNQSKEQLHAFIQDLIREGEEVLKTAKPIQKPMRDSSVNLLAFEKWRTSCKLLISQLGEFASPWEYSLSNDKARNNQRSVQGMLGALNSIDQNVQAGRLLKFEDLVYAEAFTNLIEQAEYLLAKDYFIAAGVLFRAVLEEKLRRLCDANNITTQKQRPTISDYSQELYKAKVISKIALKNIEAMTAVGNDAAHTKETVKVAVADVKAMHTNLVDFLQRN